MTRQKTATPNLYVFLIGIIALGIFIAVLSFPKGPPEFPNISIQESAYIACITLAEQQAKTEIYPNPYSRYSVRKLIERDHYGVIVYTMDGSSYQCDLARQISGRWFLKSLYVK